MALDILVVDDEEDILDDEISLVEEDSLVAEVVRDEKDKKPLRDRVGDFIGKRKRKRKDESKLETSERMELVRDIIGLDPSLAGNEKEIQAMVNEMSLDQLYDKHNRLYIDNQNRRIEFGFKRGTKKRIGGIERVERGEITEDDLYPPIQQNYAGEYGDTLEGRDPDTFIPQEDIAIIQEIIDGSPSDNTDNREFSMRHAGLIKSLYDRIEALTGIEADAQKSLLEREVRDAIKKEDLDLLRSVEKSLDTLE